MRTPRRLSLAVVVLAAILGTGSTALAGVPSGISTYGYGTASRGLRRGGDRSRNRERLGPASTLERGGRRRRRLPAPGGSRRPGAGRHRDAGDRGERQRERVCPKGRH